MSIIHIEVTDQQKAALEAAAREEGTTPQALASRVLGDFLEEAQPIDWKAALARGEGLWADRDDLPDFEQLRREWDRNLWDRE